jgi:hypothetical protein
MAETAVADKQEETVATLTTTLDRQRADLAEAKKAQAGAVQTFDKARKDSAVSSMDLKALGDAIGTAEASVGKIESAIKATEERVKLLKWEEESKDLRESNARVESAHKAAVQAEAATYAKYGVDSVTATTTALNTESPVFAARATGEKIPTAPKRARSASSGNGRGRVQYQTPSGPLGSLDLLKQYGPQSDIAERCAKMVDDPERGRHGMSHLARTLAEKLSFEATTTGS